jgi:hypothetical protein
MEYVSVFWISVTSIDATKLESILQKFSSVVGNVFSLRVSSA